MPPVFFYTVILIMIISVLLSWIKTGTIINPVAFFVIWWSIFVFVSGMNFSGIRLPRSGTYFLILLSMTMFCIGGITFLSSRSETVTGYRYGGKIISNLTDVNQRLKYFLYFQLIITIILLVFVDKGLNMLKSFDPGTYRYMVYTDYGIFQGHKVLVNYILRPAVFSSAFITISGILMGVIKKRYMGLAVFNLFLYSIVILGRSSIIMVIICFFIALLYNSSIKKIRIKTRYILLILIPIIFVISLSIFRKSHYTSKSGTGIIIDYFIWYLTGPFTALDYFINTYREGADYNFSFFRMTLSGLEDVIEPAIRKIFPEFNQIFRKYTEILGTYRDFGGPATHHNSHYTMLFTFYADAGIAGIVFYPYVSGAILASVYNNFRSRSDIFNLSILTLLTYLFMLGTTRWDFMFAWPWLTILFLFVISNKFVFENKVRSNLV